MNLLWTCTSENWNQSFGDHNLIGWATTLLYVAASITCARCVFSPDLVGHARRFERFFWMSAAVLLLLLAINKQLDLQTLISSAGRCVARAQGWLELRRQVQLVTGLVIAASLGLWGLWILAGLRHSLARMWLPLLGLFAVTMFVLMRMALLFHIYESDVFPDYDYVSRVFEIIGPVLLIASALRHIRPRRQLA